MIHIRKWTIMLVLIITLVLTTDVSALSYAADDSYVMTSQYHDIFNNYFEKADSYKYFSYLCSYGNYDRHCYYGIDNENNYLKIDYEQGGNNYTTRFSTGVDENFNVTGINIYEHTISSSRVLTYALIFMFTFAVFYLLLGVIV